jgi:hypothetical protein
LRWQSSDLDELFATYHEWGIAGVKPGFVKTGPQRWTNWLHDLVRTAARYELGSLQVSLSQQFITSRLALRQFLVRYPG